MTAISPGTLRAEMGGSGGRSSGSTALFSFLFFGTIFVGEKRPEPQKKKEINKKRPSQKKMGGKLGSVFDRDWIYRRVIAAQQLNNFVSFVLDNKNTSALFQKGRLT